MYLVWKVIAIRYFKTLDDQEKFFFHKKMHLSQSLLTNYVFPCYLESNRQLPSDTKFSIVQFSRDSKVSIYTCIICIIFWCILMHYICVLHVRRYLICIEYRLGLTNPKKSNFKPRYFSKLKIHAIVSNSFELCTKPVKPEYPVQI